MKVDILTVEEAKKLPIELLTCFTPKFSPAAEKIKNQHLNEYIIDYDKVGVDYWLNTPGEFINTVALVRFTKVQAYIDTQGENQYSKMVGVRPVIRYSEEEYEPLRRKKQMWICEDVWKNITDIIGEPAFLKSQAVPDLFLFSTSTLKDNPYEMSELKTNVDQWVDLYLGR